MADGSGPTVNRSMPSPRIISASLLRITAAGLAAPFKKYLGAVSHASLACSLLFSGCTFFKLVLASKLKPPDFSFVRCDVKSVSERSVSLEFTLAAENPNAIGLRNVFVDYELSFEGHRFMRGSTAELVLVPRGGTALKVSAEVDYAEVARAAGPAALQAMTGRESLPVRVEGAVRGKPTVYDEVEEGAFFQFTWKFAFTHEVPIPEEQKARARKKAARALKKLF